MGAVIGEILPLAIGVAVSPIPIIAAILMLFSKRAGSTSGVPDRLDPGIVVATAIFTALAGTLQTAASRRPRHRGSRSSSACCCCLVGFASGAAGGGQHETPKWMAAIDDFTFVKAVGLGFLLSAVNPKNLIMAAGAGVAIGSAG